MQCFFDVIVRCTDYYTYHSDSERWLRNIKIVAKVLFFTVYCMIYSLSGTLILLLYFLERYLHDRERY